MIATILDAKARLEAGGFYVSPKDDHSLFIAGHVTDVGDGIKISNDACGLFQHGGQWLVIFPGRGMTSREVPGQLPDLVALIEAVYRRHQSTGGDLWEAVRDVIDGAEPASPPTATGGRTNGVPAIPDANSVPQSRSQ